MRAIKGLLGVTAIAAALLVNGCGANQSDHPVNLSDPAKLNELCGTTALNAWNTISDLASAPAGSGKRNQLKAWGINDPADEQQIKEAKEKLAERPKDCTSPSASPTSTPTPTPSASPSASSTTGTGEVADSNGKREGLPTVSGATYPNGDTTKDPNTPPVSGALAIDCEKYLTGWDTLVPCIEKSGVAGEKYKAIVDKMHAEGKLSFTWSDVQKWATAKTQNGKLPEARVIQVYGYTETEMPVDQARANIADLVGGKDVANGLKVVYKSASFIDTLRPKFKDQETTDIQQFIDFNKQVRVSLVPLATDDKGIATGVETDSDSGAFADCYNIHGKAAVMPSSPGAQLVCAPGTPMAGQPLPENGICTPPTPSCTTCDCTGTCGTPQCTTCECAGNCPPPPACTTCACTGTCLTQKGPSIDNGWTPLGPGQLTNGQLSQEQQQSGQVSGNVTDNKAPSGTTSGSTTNDYTPGTVTAPGATPAPAPAPGSTPAPTDPYAGSPGAGGTGGATCQPDPFTGQSC